MSRRSSDVYETSRYRMRSALTNRRRDPAQPRGTLEAWDWRRSRLARGTALMAGQSEPTQKGAVPCGNVRPIT